MKAIINSVCVGLMGVMLAYSLQAQNIDNDRMDRDLRVAENVLQTLLRQNTSGKMYFFSEVRGNYMPGYGVIFSVPYNEFISGTVSVRSSGNSNSIVYFDGGEITRVAPTVAARTREEDERDAKKLNASLDSAQHATKANYLEAMKTFLADYGDMISQLKSEEKIMITNRPSGFSSGMRWGSRSNRTLLSAEVAKSDLNDFKQGKINRDQLIKKISIVNTQGEDKVETDLELLSSIFNRLYRSDLSKTYFLEGNLYYEKLTDFGAVYYMQVYSSTREEGDKHTMPTVSLRGLTEAERNKKVVELLPKFEQELKENMLEYGRTVKSLKPSELLIFSVKLTKCEGCNIPSTLELSVKAEVLQDYLTGKITKDGALAKINVKKGPVQ